MGKQNELGTELDGMAHTCNPRNTKAEAEGYKVQA